MDIKKLQQAVFERTGIRLDNADPVFALVALNEIVVAQLLASAEEGRTQTNAEMDAKIASMVKIYEQIVVASKELTARVDQAHLAAALKAAAEAKSEIMIAARDVIGAEVVKATAILTGRNPLAATKAKVSAADWAIAITQAVIGGMVAASIVLTATTFLRW